MKALDGRLPRPPAAVVRRRVSGLGGHTFLLRHRNSFLVCLFHGRLSQARWPNNHLFICFVGVAEDFREWLLRRALYRKAVYL